MIFRFYAKLSDCRVGLKSPNGSEIDFLRNLISDSAARFFVKVLKFILSPIFEFKIHEKKFLTPK